MKRFILVVTVIYYSLIFANANLYELRDTLQRAINDLDLLEESPLGKRVPTHVAKPSNCLELKYLGHTTSGVYTIYPKVWYNIPPLDVYCDMQTDGGGWIVFQRRNDYGEPRESFYRSWEDYKTGFGNLSQEFWLGNDYISVLSNQDQVKLRIDLEDFENEKRHATYRHFHVASAMRSYKLSVGEYEGTETESFIPHNGNEFVTFDQNDTNECAKKFKGGWWYKKCHSSNLNGLYLKGKHESYADGIEWHEWHGHHYSLKATEMKIRPRLRKC